MNQKYIPYPRNIPIVSPSTPHINQKKTINPKAPYIPKPSLEIGRSYYSIHGHLESSSLIFAAGGVSSIAAGEELTSQPELTTIGHPENAVLS
jgi:hypothetical protein